MPRGESPAPKETGDGLTENRIAGGNISSIVRIELE